MLMPPHIASIIAADHGRALRDRAQADRLARRRSSARRARLRGLLRRERAPLAASVALEADVTIRLARPADQRALRRLAELDSRRVPGGEVLVARSASSWPLRCRSPEASPVADPFLPTAGLISLLGVRAGQLREAGEQPVAAPVPARAGAPP